MLKHQSKRRVGIRTKKMILIAAERIDRLFALAFEEALRNNFKRANRYVILARKIGMRYNVRIPKKYKQFFCRKCSSFLLPALSSRVRLARKRVIVYCYNCGNFRRVPYIKGKQAT